MSSFEVLSSCSLEIWKGFIPLKVDVCYEDVTSSEAPASVFIMAHRHSYLPVILEAVIEQFQQQAVEFSSDIWFDCLGFPLQSTYPVGVLFDLFGNQHTPMQITVHFQGFPAQKLLKCTSSRDSEHFFFHSLKQALFLLHGNTKPFNDLTVCQQRKLWKSIHDGDRTSYEEIALDFRPQPLASTVSDVAWQHSLLRSIKSLPIRVMRLDSPTIQRQVSLWKVAKQELEDNSIPVQPPEMRSLGDILTHEFGISVSEHRQLIVQSSGNATLPPCWSPEGIIIQGIVAPLSAPVYDVWRLFSHCDLFLYIVLRSS